MKRIALLIAGIAAGFAANAQLSLSGSSYTQNFDNIGNGLPAGWEVDSLATPTSKGVVMAFDTTKTAWSVTTGKFKNFASKGTFAVNNIPSATQSAATDRALGVRQVGSLDSMIAFELQITNTSGLTGFNLGFDLMSLDSTTPRTSTWAVDYGFGASPSSFTTANATGTLTTGNGVFSSNHITVNFGSALDNQTGTVWIRVIVPHRTTGSGTRSSAAIDNFNLTWNGSGVTNYRPLVSAKNPTNGATGVLPTTNLAVTFDRNISKGSGNIYLKNRTTQHTDTFAVTASSVAVAAKVATITTGFLLDSNTVYHVTFDSTAFDTASYRSYGIYDTTAWMFTTIPNASPVITVTSLSENFDNACATGSTNQMPNGWSKYSVTGAQQWNCYSYGYQSTPCYNMNGYQTSVNYVNEDWLITPRMDLSAMSAAYFTFRAYKKFAGDDMKVMVSNSYSGNGAPTGFIDLAVNFSAVDTNFKQFSADISSYKSQPVFVAFKYTSDASNAAQWKVDNVLVSATPASVANLAKNNMELTVVGNSTSNNITLMFDVKQAGAYTVSVLDITGREIVRRNVTLGTGVQRFSVDGMSLNSGMYIVKMSNENSFGATKAVVQ
ncbi:T9SS-dependent choice-of-anchor J family protein [Taibaiella soli]|uniref:SbsA Ig-like domain-containing protein n=1 Tax=Taibaiella soli TaxID=1649169 RepID=A0A2W2BVX1_9BACT|nr:choice-of-anchor J domain-containing protein [Taibaiella soli]PZF71983.1 hypothetical protein DN068_15215 [Taibaiella soli]